VQQIFESFIESFLAQKVGVSEQFLNKVLASQLKENLQNLFNQDKMKTAGTGNELMVHKDSSFRSDKIYWLEKDSTNTSEIEFFKLMDEFVVYLNETCYTGITQYEFHYALYEKGNLYKRHLDRFRNDDHRLFSMITYLNEDWIDGDGGELKIYLPEGQTQNISPTNGKSVFFRSNELEHEVLVTHKPRMSITGWLKR